MTWLTLRLLRPYLIVAGTVTANPDDGPAAVTENRSEAAPADDDVDRLIEQLSEAELRDVLAELERQPIEQEAREAHS